ncbi:MAG: hypothetical protein ACYDEJ_16610 [Desulfitobacteriaceae bacterium]
MKNIPLIEKLEKEKEKLTKLANEAMRKGIPLTQDKEFMAQNQKVDVLVVKIQKINIYKPTTVIPNDLM